MSVFVDTSALYALLDEADAHHVESSDALGRLIGTELVTHAYVVVEACALVGRRLPWPATERLVDGIGERKISVIGLPGALSAAEYEALGVARISHGPMTQRVALTALQDVANDLYGTGVIPATTRSLN